MTEETIINLSIFSLFAFQYYLFLLYANSSQSPTRPHESYAARSTCKVARWFNSGVKPPRTYLCCWDYTNVGLSRITIRSVLA